MTGNGTADIVLGECNGQAWLVRGEQHIDDLLGNTLAAHVSIEIIACESKSAIDALWRGYGGDADDTDMMWVIHPAIVNRTRGKIRGVSGEITIIFAEWSAALDEAAMAGVRAAADVALHREGAVLSIVSHVAEGGPPMAAEIANLRSGLLEAQLASLGVQPGAMKRDTQSAEQGGHVNRIALVIREDPG